MISPEAILTGQPATEGMHAWPAAGLTALFACPHPAARPARPA